MDADEIQQRIQELLELLAVTQKPAQLAEPPVDVLHDFAIAQRARGYADTTIRNRVSILRTHPASPSWRSTIRRSRPSWAGTE
jgi:hypothetical protein